MKLFIFSIFIFVFLSLSLLFFFHISRRTLAINGCFCNSSSSCYPDGCTRKTIKTDGTIDYNLCRDAGCNGAYNSCYDTSSTVVSQYFCLQQPPCCTDMVGRNTPEACCWPERGFCHPFYCNQVSRPERCGWYWEYHDGYTNSQQGYGCMKGSPENMQPIYGLPPGVPGGQPTVTPYPTSIPTIPPTLIPTQYISPTRIPTTKPTSFPTEYISPTGYISPTEYFFPTQYIPPTDIPVVYPTNYISDSPSFSFPSFTFPSINMEPLKISLRNTVVGSEKILQIPTEVAKKITQLDASLETSINQFIQNLINRLVQLINQLV